MQEMAEQIKEQQIHPMATQYSSVHLAVRREASSF